ncbi:hypothetical protein BDV59DRAFT_10576 [Aspergillus ambiguus]|uniref:uncharacterized protein n=1 Tax=Aspergillus ambiguus TaxID=176160 RepID=UPI003CCD9367
MRGMQQIEVYLPFLFLGGVVLWHRHSARSSELKHYFSLLFFPYVMLLQVLHSRLSMFCRDGTVQSSSE